MKFIQSKNLATQETINIAYNDYGVGKPVILIHGWPVNKHMWEYQLEAIIGAGYRVIKYDRRGFGQSDKPWDGYDYDNMAYDLKMLIAQLNLEDVTLIGFSMGGGEVARYFGKYGGEKVSKAVFIGSVLPFLLKTDDNPDGVDGSVFQTMIAGLNNDRMGFMAEFGKNFFGIDAEDYEVSQAYLDYYSSLAAVASGRASRQCVKAFGETDFRQDLSKINVPTLIIHGTADKIVPIEVSSDKAAPMIANNQYIKYDGAPHGLFFTHKEKLNEDLVAFLKS